MQAQTQANTLDPSVYLNQNSINNRVQPQLMTVGLSNSHLAEMIERNFFIIAKQLEDVLEEMSILKEEIIKKNLAIEKMEIDSDLVGRVEAAQILGYSEAKFGREYKAGRIKRASFSPLRYSRKYLIELKGQIS